MKIKSWLLLTLTLALTACASQKKQQIDLSYIATNTPPAETSSANAQNQIAQTATAVSGSLQELSAISLATHPKAQLTPMDPQQLGMTQLTSLDWYGPIEPLLRKIATASGYHVRCYGQQPATAIVVSINAHNLALGQILQNAAYQVQRQADVEVDAKQRVIYLIYRNR